MPDYIIDLVAKKYFEEEAFLSYLQYLRYWKEPEYLRLLKVPQCLDTLDMLLDPNVRKELLTKGKTNEMSILI